MLPLLADCFSLFFPRPCLACAAPLVAGEAHLCTACRAELPYTDYHRLPPAQSPLAPRFWGRLPVEHALSYLRFERHGRVQQLLHQLKYRGQREVGQALGQLYGAELATTPALAAAFELIVPVPLHRRKQARRGYNQAEAFGEGLARALPCPQRPVLSRTEHTASQTRRGGRLARWENVAAVFEVAEPQVVAGHHVLLVDDVLTTGATLEACGHALLGAGARQLSIATIACA